jgi:hypothetical protein
MSRQSEGQVLVNVSISMFQGIENADKANCARQFLTRALDSRGGGSSPTQNLLAYKPTYQRAFLGLRIWAATL